MKEKGYEVLKMVMRLDRCYIGSDYVVGVPLAVWIKTHKVIPKEQLFYWCHEIPSMLEHFQKSRGEPYYQYVNPYSIIIDREEHLHFLDLGSAQQSHLVHFMQKRQIRENFLSPDNQYYQKTGPEEDIYGLGKTIQYILAMQECSPPLSSSEERKFRKTISRCLAQNSKKQFQTVQEVSEHFPKHRKTENVKKSKKKGTYSLLFLVIIFISILAFKTNQKDMEHMKQKEKKNIQEENIVKKEVETIQKIPQKDSETLMDMGFFYLLEAKNYEKAKGHFQELSEQKEYGEDYVNLCKWLENPAYFDEKIMKAKMNKMIDNVPDQNDIRYYQAILQGLLQFSKEDVSKEKIKVALMCLAEFQKNKDLKNEKNIKQILAASYEKNSEYEEAVRYYESLLSEEENVQERTKIFLKISDILYQNKDYAKTAEICKKGIEENEKETGLWILLIRSYCEQQPLDTELITQTVKEAETAIEGFAENEEVIKLKEEYSILS